MPAPTANAAGDNRSVGLSHLPARLPGPLPSRQDMAFTQIHAQSQTLKLSASPVNGGCLRGPGLRQRGGLTGAKKEKVAPVESNDAVSDGSEAPGRPQAGYPGRYESIGDA